MTKWSSGLKRHKLAAVELNENFLIKSPRNGDSIECRRHTRSKFEKRKKGRIHQGREGMVTQINKKRGRETGRERERERYKKP